MAWDEPEYFDVDSDPEGPTGDDLARGSEPAERVCPECGRLMLDEAEVCPHCGCWVRSGEFRGHSGGWGRVLVAVVLLVGVVVLIVVLR